MARSWHVLKLRLCPVFMRRIRPKAAQKTQAGNLGTYPTHFFTNLRMLRLEATGELFWGGPCLSCSSTREKVIVGKPSDSEEQTRAWALGFRLRVKGLGHVNYNLNTLNGVYLGDYIGEFYRASWGGL